MTSPTPPDVAKEHTRPWKVVRDDENYPSFKDANGRIVIFGPAVWDFLVAAVNATQVGWTPASAPPTGTGWYAVLWRNGNEWPEHAKHRSLYWDGKDFRDHANTPSCNYPAFTKAVAFWLPLPPLPEKEST